MNIQLIIIFLLVFIGIFIKPFSYGVGDFIYKFLVFVGATYLIYKNFVQNFLKELPIDTQLKEDDIEVISMAFRGLFLLILHKKELVTLILRV